MAAAAVRIAAAHGMRVVVTGAPGDTARGAALIKGGRLLLCCNSSAMHMPGALGTPALVLFAGT
ncbi:hypothetical protein [uncultured Jannaschia sp.]|uniref:glycosyltransferase family 9 protein n=1 Tax=uncultured Jannaschia sp. TaxID=293347 RepID=UPI002610F187|nr:hypothetical protein [uncultured Jannaschia sp.]